MKTKLKLKNGTVIDCTEVPSVVEGDLHFDFVL